MWHFQVSSWHVSFSAWNLQRIKSVELHCFGIFHLRAFQVGTPCATGQRGVIYIYIYIDSIYQYIILSIFQSIDLPIYESISIFISISISISISIFISSL